MNILLTLDCNLDCAYCFARARRSASTRQEMTLEELETLLSQMDPDVDEVRLMGGEPTLHTRYAEVMRLIKSAGFIVTVFTNGTQASLRQSTTYLPDTALLNLNDWQTYSEAQGAEILDNLAALGNRVGLGYTITQPDFDLADHISLIREYGLKPAIRIGIAQPVLDGENEYLPDDALPAAHRSVVRWAAKLAADGIRLNFDCGFMRCYFNDTDIEILVRAKAALRFICRPSMDVGPGLQTWRCFAFSAGPGVDWRSFEDASQAQAWFERQDRLIETDCEDCNYYQSGWCQGGCLARRVIRSSEEEVMLEGLRENIGMTTR
jgi:radical SAM protein with 4Fe4S-binding SPASM domain